MTADGAHDEPGCPGFFVPVRNPSNDAASEGPDAMVCPRCGAWCAIEDLAGGG